MGISIFPSTAAEFVSNNFVVDMNDSTNNTADTGGVKQAGPYSMSFSSGDTSFDVYLINEDGDSVGYSNTTSIEATGLFVTVVIFGVATDEVISFTYQGSVNNADGEGDEPGAGAYLESITPSDLPSIDDTATVIGGNFGTATQFTFESGTVVLTAKNASIISGTEALVTRPDGLIEDNAPYDFKAVNPGVQTPTTKDFVLVDAVTAGSDPTWVTTSLPAAQINDIYNETLEATDADGAVSDYSLISGTLPTGLSLNNSTGVISGTVTASGTNPLTFRATDDGGNITDKELELIVDTLEGGTVTTDGTSFFHTFTSSDDLIINDDITVSVLLVAGGGGGGEPNPAEAYNAGGGGGAGGLFELTGQTLTAGTVTLTIGAGGAVQTSGSDTVFPGVGTAVGGGFGASDGVNNTAGDGGSGGGGAGTGSGGTAIGTPSQGFPGGDNDIDVCGSGGGGASAAGLAVTADPANPRGNGGDGLLCFDGVTRGGGGGGGAGGVSFSFDEGLGGAGGGGDGADARGGSRSKDSIAGAANTGGGGGAGAENTDGAGYKNGSAGGSGIIVVKVG